MIMLTSEAAQQVLRAAGQTGAQGSPLRIAARVDADGATQYGMGFDEQREPDMLIQCEGVAVLISPGSVFSTSATFAPTCAAVSAAFYPPGPLPMTIRSKFMFRNRGRHQAG